MSENVRLIPSVRGIIFNKNGELLLVANHDSKQFYLPGGWVDGFESLQEAIKREIYEETGLIIEPRELVYVSEYKQTAAENKFHENIHKIETYFLCHVLDGEVSDSWKDSDNQVQQRRFFSKNEALNNKDILHNFVSNGEIFDLLLQKNVYNAYRS